MAKYANAGQMRTPITIKTYTAGTNDNGFTGKTMTAVFTSAVYCYWQNAYGSEFLEASRQNLREPATITMRYSPLVKVGQFVFRSGDTEPFEIIGVDNVGDKNEWLELKVTRAVAV